VPLSPRQALIGDLQEFQQALGVERTGNFRRYAGERHAIYRCYFTGKLELPESYEGLRLVERDEPACALDESEYDVFLYAIEAVASGESPVSPALAEAPLERVLVVVPHEDFHNQRETKRASADIVEAAATLVGFLTAADFARARYGETSEAFQRLALEPARFLDKANQINGVYARLARVYDAFRAGTLTREEALARKAALFEDLAGDCGAAPAASFNTCPAVMNNAGLAFDRTYTRYYAAWFELYEALGRDTMAAVAAFKRVLGEGPRSEAELRRAHGAARP
jgi:hypothetical protein